MLNFGNKEFRNLQEQVLKNAQDIEVLKGRANLQVVIVEELPEEGNPNYIYLVPNNDEEESNVYDEYIWLEEAEEYEKIGGLSIDTTNFVTVDSTQTISGVKTFSSGISVNSISSTDYGEDLELSTAETLKLIGGTYGIETKGSMLPQVTTTDDIGSSSKKYKDLYLGGNAYFDNEKEIQFATTSGGSTKFYIKSISNTFHIGAANIASSFVLDSYLTRFIPESATQDLGDGTHYWRNLYLTGNISDGANTVSVANIASKVTSTQASGTFDSNGESTILDGASISEGLYIFTYGNCQCFVRLTATMVQSSDVTPIRVACPMIVTGSPSSGWLNITKSGSNLVISVTDGNDHVDSGFAWTLTKTNLI